MTFANINNFTLYLLNRWACVDHHCLTSSWWPGPLRGPGTTRIYLLPFSSRHTRLIHSTTRPQGRATITQDSSLQFGQG
jgi:hypothetical protein